MITVKLDTSVYIAMLNLYGFGTRIWVLAADATIRIDISAPILDEVVRILRDKFSWDPYRLHDARERILGLTNCVVPTQQLAVIAEDPPDNRILECAVEACSQYILSWDKDLLRLREYPGIQILTPAAFMSLRP